MTTKNLHACRHCGINFRWNPLVLETEGGIAHHFCCRGCLGAYQLICGAGLEAFYQRPDRAAPSVTNDSSRQISTEELNASIQPDGDSCRIDILIGGISCPSCIWLLERVLGRHPGVVSVSLTYSAGTAAVRFDPEATTPADIYELISRLGYQPRPYSATRSVAAERREREDLLIRLGTGIFLTMQLMAYSFALYAGYFQGMSAGMKDIMQLFSFAVTTPVVFYCGWPFFRGAWQGLKTSMPGMDMLIAVGAGSAWLYSSYAALTKHETYFESAAVIVTFVLIGRLMELSVRRKAMSGLSSLYSAIPQHATLLDGTDTRLVQVSDIRPGDQLLIRSGERFPVDVRITLGETEVDQSMVTGESNPVLARAGDEIKSGSINLTLTVNGEALRPVGLSYVMRVAALVQMAQAEKPAIQRLVDRIAARFVPMVMLLAAADFAWMVFMGNSGTNQALLTALSVVLIACPCALGLAVPTAVLAACSSSAARGVILRGGEVIERLSGIDVALLDKTGTLTSGSPAVVSWKALNGFEQDIVLQATVSLEQSSSHPLARAIEQLAADQGILPTACTDVVPVPGRGIAGKLADGRELLCGSPRFLVERGIDIGEMITAVPPGTIGTPILVAIVGRLAGFFLLSDQLRAGAEELAAWYNGHGIETWLVSGDTEAIVSQTAHTLGLNQFRAEMTPDEKRALVCDLQSAGKQVLMAGDGVNDAPALASARVSCSFSGSSDLALENADLIITGKELYQFKAAHQIARSTMKIIRQNLIWAFLYNVIGIPLAMSGLLTPVYAAAAMTASSLMVSLNSLRLMRKNAHG